jgi:hypothetical protein
VYLATEKAFYKIATEDELDAVCSGACISACEQLAVAQSITRPQPRRETDEIFYGHRLQRYYYLSLFQLLTAVFSR